MSASRALLIALLGVAALALVATPASAQKKPPAVNATSFVPFSSGSTVSSTANCRKGTHVTGGGWSVSPTFDPGSGTGLRSINSTSAFAGTTGWTATSDAFANPPGSGRFTTFARCESNHLGKTGTAVSGSATVPSGTLNDVVLECPVGTHVVTGGYSGTGLAGFSNSTGNLRMLVLQSRRTAKRDWTISAFESSLNSASGNISASALCEQNARRAAPRELSASTPFGSNSRASGTVACPSKQHVLAGGYALSPRSGQPPVVGIDEFDPTGKRSWHLGLHTVGAEPAGASVTTYAYCAKDTRPKRR